MTHTAVAEEANGDLNKDKLPRPYCGEIAFTDREKVTAHSPERHLYK